MAPNLPTPRLLGSLLQSSGRNGDSCDLSEEQLFGAALRPTVILDGKDLVNVGNGRVLSLVFGPDISPRRYSADNNCASWSICRWSRRNKTTQECEISSTSPSISLARLTNAHFGFAGSCCLSHTHARAVREPVAFA